MDGKEYIKSALVTEKPNDPDMLARLSDPRLARLLHAAIGLCTESGEIQDNLKRHIFYGTDIDEVNLKEELGDIMWYIAVACDTLGISLEEVMQKNVDKLKARFGGQFTSEKAVSRDLEEEKAALTAATPPIPKKEASAAKAVKLEIEYEGSTHLFNYYTEESGCWAEGVSLKGVQSQGGTMRDLHANLKEALRAYFKQ